MFYFKNVEGISCILFKVFDRTMMADLYYLMLVSHFDIGVKIPKKKILSVRDNVRNFVFERTFFDK